MAAIVDINSKCDHTIEVCGRNQPTKNKLGLYRPFFHFNSHLKLLYVSNKTECFSYKGESGIRILRHLKEELALATDK